MWKYKANPYEIRPHEWSLRADVMQSYIKKHQEGKIRGFGLLPAILLDGCPVLLDRHHRCGSLFLLNKDIVLGILETDEEVRKCKESYVAPFQNMKDLYNDARRIVAHARSQGVERFPEIKVTFSDESRGLLNEEGMLERVMNERAPPRPKKQKIPQLSITTFYQYE